MEKDVQITTEAVKPKFWQTKLGRYHFRFILSLQLLLSWRQYSGNCLQIC